MRIAQLWRYPVKSMAGEPLQEIEVAADGFTGDRLVGVVDPRGRVVTARNRPRLLGHRGTLGAGGEPLVDGRPWTSEEVARDVLEAAGPGTQLMRLQGELRRFDVLPLLVATDGAIEAFGHDGRRLRPNIVLGGVPGLEERSWEGRKLRAGRVVIELVDLRERCIMTTFEPDTLEQDVEVLKHIRRAFDGKLALNARVLEAGTLSVGDEIQLVA